MPHEKQCNLVFEGMAIKKAIVWDPTKGVMYGFAQSIDYGCSVDGDVLVD